jgi:N-acetylglucosaminyldiphosphoundecaprenol N-acetyl-beta-D-mannosaminyltransferase
MKRDFIKILDIKIDNVSRKEAIERLPDLMSQKGQSIITTPNAEFVISAQTDQIFKNILNEESKLNLPDGYGLLWAAKYLSLPPPQALWSKILTGLFCWIITLISLPIFVRIKKQPLPERIPGSDFIWDIARFAAENNHKLFLLGGAATVAERTALKLRTEIIDLRIGGVHAGNAEDAIEIIEAINRSHSDILLVGFGAPKQEKWLSQYLKKTTCKIGVGLGGSFDFVAGTKQRAPIWMQKTGLEWLFRLFYEPSRIKRQFAIPKLMWQVLKAKITTQN